MELAPISEPKPIFCKDTNNKWKMMFKTFLNKVYTFAIYIFMLKFASVAKTHMIFLNKKK